MKLVKNENELRKENVTDKEAEEAFIKILQWIGCLLYTSPSPRDRTRSRMPSSA